MSVVVIMFLMFTFPMIAMEWQADDRVLRQAQDDRVTEEPPEEQMTLREKLKADEMWEEEMEEQELLYFAARQRQLEQHQISADGSLVHKKKED